MHCSTDCGVAHRQQGYETANQTKYAREAIKWGADYLMKAHIDENTFVAQVGSPLIDGELRICRYPAVCTCLIPHNHDIGSDGAYAAC